MIIARTPFRMSFFGGGTDLPDFFKIYGGSVISSTFDKYCYVTVRHLPPFFDYKDQITYSKIERVESRDQLQHPAVRETMKFLDMREIVMGYDADLPARTGLGTSSSFVVGMLNAFYAMKGKYVDKKRIADDAIYIERSLCNEAGGWQDQIAASYGGLNRIDFDETGYTVHPIIITNDRKKELNDNLMLFFTGFSRYSSEIQEDTSKTLEEHIEQLKELKDLVDEAQNILVNKNSNLNDFGKLLDKEWKIKRSTGKKISNSKIDSIYENAIRAGATGGKLLGAGGGGFLLFYVKKDRQNYVRNKLSYLLQVPFKFEDAGTDIIYYAYEPYDLDVKE